jgi:N,N'-diacetyllegionaminate synthase
MPYSILKIAGYEIGIGNPCFIIAEAGVNHNGSLDIARQMVQVAARAGADAIKFQTFKAEKLTTAHAPKAAYQAAATGENESQLQMLRKLELSNDDFQRLLDECHKNNILFLSTPFDEDSADFLASLNMAAFKISSGELTNLPFLIHVARKGKPVILSTGMSYLNEVDLAVRAIQSAGNQDLVLLHCTSNYPADPADVNLRAMITLGQAFQVPFGFSDHTMGIEIPLAAVAMGAHVLEKHFTLDRSFPGPDHQASLEPAELESLVKGVRKVEASFGHGRKEPVEREANTAAVARKSIVARTDIPAGTLLDQSHFIMMRPGIGLPSGMLEYVIGRTARVNIPAGSVISFEMFA